MEPSKNQTMSTNHDKSEEHKHIFEAAQAITGLYLLPIISCIGIFGNICNVLVFSHSKKYSTNVYLIALSLSDILKLFNDFIYFLVNLITRLDRNLGDTLFSSLYLYSHYVFVLTAINTAWLTCVIAIDRYITVSSRNQVKTSESNYFKSILISFAITLASCLMAFPSPLFLKPELESGKLNRTDSNAFFVNSKKVYNYTTAAFRAIIPIILLTYLNYKIIKIVLKNNKTRKHISSKGSNANNKAKNKSKVTKMLLVIVFTFVVCVFPDAILTMMHLGYANEGFLIRAIREVTDLLLAINSATTFFICYVFSFSYRQKFKKIFGCRTNGSPGGDLGDENDDSPLKQERHQLVSQKSRDNNTKI